MLVIARTVEIQKTVQAEVKLTNAELREAIQLYLRQGPIPEHAEILCSNCADDVGLDGPVRVKWVEVTREVIP